MIRTRVGYAGGTKENPTYTSLGDHTETFQVDFDPKKTSYEALLKIFWKSHNPCSKSFSRQYMSAVFHENEAQRKLALETKAREEAERGRTIHTQVLPAGRFYLAEDYHQKFFLRQSPIAKEYLAVYPELKDFVNSTAVTRLNAYVGGQGTRKQLEKEADRLGLTPESRQRLLDAVRR